ncbi:MAG TPA: ATP-binding protein [Thermoanaerobaculia bacterium]|nr:ATP-binding protein [Thermoanaerobaculia bacterium]
MIEPREERILILAPTGRDAMLAAGLLAQELTQEEVDCQCCGNGVELCQAIAAGAGAVLLAEEALVPATLEPLRTALADQPPWSDLPLIVFTRGDSSSGEILKLLGPLCNATLLERPVRLTTLVSAVRAALRARRRQYQVRELLRRSEEADRRKDEFLAMLGHEIRNPLAAIRNALWVLEQAGTSSEKAGRQREVMGRQIHHLTRMVDDLLDVSRVTRGKILLQPQTVNLQEVADRCLQELGMETQARSRNIEVTVSSEPVYVKGDPVRLEQVLCNLIQNGIKYTPPGGKLTLTVAREEATGQAVVRVRDTGIGIPAEMLPRVFELFTQVEASIERSQGGLGLGLPLVRSLVELHGGKVSVTSDGPGQGSEFVIRLPLIPVMPALPRPVSPGAGTGTRSRPLPAAVARPERPGGQGLCVLIVEDNADGRESMRELLEIWGHNVVLAETGLEGVEKALTFRPDVALVDIGLPGIDGNEVARRIRTTFDSQQVCLIAMTGYGQPEDRRRALQAGFDNYLIKPVDPARLSALLDGVRERVRQMPSDNTQCDGAALIVA